ncbi:MAG: M56 family metallopeptidase, partial [Verrucomicrobiota bacterium]
MNPIITTLTELGPALILFHLLGTAVGAMALLTVRNTRNALQFSRISVAILVLAPLLLLAASRLKLPDDRSKSPLPTFSQAIVPLKSTALAAGANPASAPSRTLSPILLAGILWLLGTLCLISKLVRDLCRLHRHLRGLSIPPRHLSEGLADLQECLDSPKDLTLLFDPGPTAPYSFRLRRSYLVLTPNFFEQNPGQRICILKHELSHLRNRDTLDCLAWRLLRCFYWWNPVSHWLEKRVRELQEWRADNDAVQMDPGEAIRFSRLLLEIASPAPSRFEHSISSKTHRELKRRIHRLVKPENQGPTRLRTGLNVSLMVLFFTSLIACSRLIPEQPPVIQPSSAVINFEGDLAEIEAIEKRLRKVKDRAQTDDLITVEMVVLKRPPSGKSDSPTTRILTPVERTDFITNTGPRASHIS